MGDWGGEVQKKFVRVQWEIKVARTYLHACCIILFLIRVFQNERFHLFLRFLASLINNDGTIRKCYSFS